MLWLLLVVSFVTRALFLFHQGTPEPDSMLIAGGVALGATGNMPFPETFLYGRQLNPGVYLFMRAAYPLLWSDPRNVLSILNWTSVICGALTVPVLYDLLRLHLSKHTALLGTAVWVFTPLAWETQTYFHPQVPATLFLLLALVCARRIDRGVRGGLFATATVLLACLAVLVRSEVAIAWPAVAAFAFASRNRRRSLIMLGVVTIITAIVYAAVLNVTAGPNTDARGNIGQFWDRWGQLYGMSVSVRGIPRALTWAFLGLGLASLVACVAGLVGWLRRRDVQPGTAYTAGILLWLLPSLLFWAPYTVPILRHYYQASLGLAPLLGLWFFRGMDSRRATLLAALIVGLNLAVPEALYRAYNATHPSDNKTPYGAFFYHHETASVEIARLAGLREAAMGCTREDWGRAHSIVLCRYNGYVNVIYEMATRSSGVMFVESRSIPAVTHVHYTSKEADIQLINYVYLEDSTVRERAGELLEDARRAGYCLFLPLALREQSWPLGDASSVIWYP